MPDPTIEPLEPPMTLGERVVEVLEDLIADGVLPPGAHLVETELAARLGVSRGPVREALQHLQRDGWVDLRPRQGAFVRAPTGREVDEFFHVRALLEAECARLAALHLTEEGARRLQAALEAGLGVAPHGTTKELLAANSELHATVNHIADNRVLDDLVSRMRKRSRWYFTPVSTTRRSDAWREHEALVTAILDGDAEAAAAQMRDHVEATRTAYRAVVDPAP